MAESANAATGADGTCAFIGLGLMGLPMARRLIGAGFRVRGADVSQAAREHLAELGGNPFATAREAAVGASLLITMLPNGAIVRDVLFGAEGAATELAPGALVIDMSSSRPLETIETGEKLEQLGIGLIDAPVSGGVRRAIDGTLAVIVGGPEALLERGRPLLSALGKEITHVGPLGAGHAMKALNNYVSAAGLAAASEALLIGAAFGLAPEIIVDVLNVSSGRNNSTESKLKPFVLSESYASGFAIGLMAKDVRIAADLAERVGVRVPGVEAAAELWEQAATEMGGRADHTSIHKYLRQFGPRS